MENPLYHENEVIKKVDNPLYEEMNASVIEHHVHVYEMSLPNRPLPLPDVGVSPYDTLETTVGPDGNSLYHFEYDTLDNSIYEKVDTSDFDIYSSI